MCVMARYLTSGGGTFDVLTQVSYLTAQLGPDASRPVPFISTSVALPLQMQFHVHQHFLKRICLVQQPLGFVK